MNLARMIQATLGVAALACCATPTGFGQQNPGGAIGLEKYRLVRGPIEIAGLHDNASGLAYSPVSKTLFQPRIGGGPGMHYRRQDRCPTIAPARQRRAGPRHPQGITMDAEGRLYVCSEPNLLYVFSK